jgi:hypothetical protein
MRERQGIDACQGCIAQEKPLANAQRRLHLINSVGARAEAKAGQQLGLAVENGMTV